MARRARTAELSHIKQWEGEFIRFYETAAPPAGPNGRLRALN